MRNILLNMVVVAAFALGFVACDTDIESIQVQKPFKYTEEYYANLRAYKETDHAICYVWFADYQSTTSPAYRFAGLPDSVDIVSLWGGIPQPDVNPVAYKEMWEMRNKKGTKIVSVYITQIRMYQKELGLKDEDIVLDYPEGETPMWIKTLADWMLQTMWDNKLDGIDLDNEPNGDVLDGKHFTTFVKYLGSHIGPKGADTTKLLVVDGWTPQAAVSEYINYLVSQAYASSGAGDLQSRYNTAQSSNIPAHKFIVTENIGDYYPNGGVPFTEADGRTHYDDGKRIYSLEGMARWNPTQGRKGGFGAFYVQRDYNTNESGGDKSMPYGHLRRAIQFQNPAILK